MALDSFMVFYGECHQFTVNLGKRLGVLLYIQGDFVPFFCVFRVKLTPEEMERVDATLI